MRQDLAVSIKLISKPFRVIQYLRQSLNNGRYTNKSYSSTYIQILCMKLARERERGREKVLNKKKTKERERERDSSVLRISLRILSTYILQNLP